LPVEAAAEDTSQATEHSPVVSAEELLVVLVQPLIMTLHMVITVKVGRNLPEVLVVAIMLKPLRELAEMVEMDFQVCTNLVQVAAAVATSEVAAPVQECHQVVDLDMLAVLQFQQLLQEMHQCLIRPVEIWLADQGMATSESPMSK
jgi:hypothetical protein